MTSDPQLLRISYSLDTGIVAKQRNPLTTLVDVNCLRFPRKICE
jgi:hypothetical protein